MFVEQSELELNEACSRLAKPNAGDLNETGWGVDISAGGGGGAISKLFLNWFRLASRESYFKVE